MSDYDRTTDIIGLLAGDGWHGLAVFCSVEAFLDRLERAGLEDMP